MNWGSGEKGSSAVESFFGWLIVLCLKIYYGIMHDYMSKNKDYTTILKQVHFVYTINN